MSVCADSWKRFQAVDIRIISTKDCTNLLYTVHDTTFYSLSIDLLRDLCVNIQEQE